jgi:phage baseplate assembly protein W
MGVVLPAGGDDQDTFSNLEVMEDTVGPPPSDLVIITPGPLAYNTLPTQHSLEAVQSGTPNALGYNEIILQHVEEQHIDSSGDVGLSLNDPSIHPETTGWTLLTLIPVPPPTLESGPATPNARFTTKPMEWSVNGNGNLAVIEELFIEDRFAVINGIVQPGFTGTVSPNGIDSYDISIVADEDFGSWQSKYALDWRLQADNGAQVNFVGQIVKYVSLPYPDDISEIEPTYLRNFDFPFRFKPDGDAVMTTDERGIEHNMRNSIMILQQGIPLATSLGSRVPTLPFDPEDDAIRALIVQEAVRAVGIGEPRVRLDPSLRVVDSGGTNKVTVAIPYLVRSTVKWQDLLFTIPVLRTIDKSN